MVQQLECHKVQLGTYYHLSKSRNALVRSLACYPGFRLMTVTTATLIPPSATVLLLTRTLTIAPTSNSPTTRRQKPATGTKQATTRTATTSACNCAFDSSFLRSESGLICCLKRPHHCQVLQPSHSLQRLHLRFGRQVLPPRKGRMLRLCAFFHAFP
jgi:hypothetical protein